MEPSAKTPRRMAGRSLPMSPLRSGDPEIHGTTTGRDRWDRLNLVKKMLELWLNYVELWLSCCGRDVWFETVMKGTNKSFISCVMYVMWVMFFFFFGWSMLELDSAELWRFQSFTRDKVPRQRLTPHRFGEINLVVSSTNPRSPQIHPNTIGNHLDTPDFHQLLQGTIFMFTYFTSYVDKPSSHSWIELDCQRLEREIPWEQWPKLRFFSLFTWFSCCPSFRHPPSRPCHSHSH